MIKFVHTSVEVPKIFFTQVRCWNNIKIQWSYILNCITCSHVKLINAKFLVKFMFYLCSLHSQRQLNYTNVANWYIKSIQICCRYKKNMPEYKEKHL